MNRRTTITLALTGLSLCLLMAVFLPGGRLAAQDADKVLQILDDDGLDDDGDAAGANKNEATKKEASPAGTASSENADQGDGKAAGPQPLFHFRDKSKVAGFPDFRFLEVETSYGVLKIPTTDLVRVRFARRVSPEVKETIAKLIEQLGDEDFDARQSAAGQLAEIGLPALPALRKAVKSTHEEVKRKAEELLSEIYALEQTGERSAENDGLPPLHGTEDEIISTRMTVRGKVAEERFVIRSRYGTLEVETGLLAGIVFRVVGPSSRKVSVAATFQPPGNWFDSKLDLERGQRFKISASGIISVSNYGVSCGPDGTTQYSSSRSYQGFPVLALVGKVGKKGKAFLIGSNHKGKSSGSGKLYLAITPFYYNPHGALGNYQVKIDVAPGSR